TRKMLLDEHRRGGALDQAERNTRESPGKNLPAEDAFGEQAGSGGALRHAAKLNRCAGRAGASRARCAAGVGLTTSPPMCSHQTIRFAPMASDTANTAIHAPRPP